MTTATATVQGTRAEDNGESEVASNRPSAQLSDERLKKMLSDMMLIRRFEERTMQAYQQAKIGGFCHIYAGQEAAAVGTEAAITLDEPIVTAYRDHGYALARGMDPRYVMAEMFSKASGCAKGKGGSMHMFDKTRNFLGGHAIVGGQIPLAVGVGFAIQYRAENQACLCYLGDGALNQGSFHESMNLAAIFNLPIVFVLENNEYSMGTHILRGTAMGNDIREKVEGYGIRYAECDGQDVLGTYDTFMNEVPKTRNARPIHYNENEGMRDELPTYNKEGRTPGPCLVHVKTYRYQGHSMSDPQKYRSKEEVSEYQETDCIDRMSRHLVESGHATQEEVDEFDKQAKKTAREALNFAEQDQETSYDELYTDVYANPYPPYKHGEPSVILRES